MVSFFPLFRGDIEDVEGAHTLPGHKYPIAPSRALLLTETSAGIMSCSAGSTCVSLSEKKAITSGS